ncbi:unnamed protein product [Didymodactylos carnosus]|uniref:Uncharacterized protein n=1 Tax=Didymodactylos carnosus TaxID=1234261 RepID=A0A815K2N2_9BILA|nr:unnamed protein product [Didymodactylos carnosus]CAF1387773.1 unnamed protein product [Didymodactylos carnosus]CAF4099432.1 unnamed protein product [Didymodactylos carnosus]CAF4282599.1 unnamed protein product [Didymodactylos carnosus]
MWSADDLQVTPKPPENEEDAFFRSQGKMAITVFLTTLQTCGFHRSVQLAELYNALPDPVPNPTPTQSPTLTFIIPEGKTNVCGVPTTFVIVLGGTVY